MVYESSDRYLDATGVTEVSLQLARREVVAGAPARAQAHARVAGSAGAGYLPPLKRPVRERNAGPIVTMNIDGKMNSTVGKSILIGAFMARSSASD